VATGEVEADGVGSGVEALFGKALTKVDDLLFEPDRDLVRTSKRPPGPGLEPLRPFRLEPLHQFVDPPPGHPVVPRHLRLRPSQLPDRRDHELPQTHRPPSLIEVCTMSRDRCELFVKPDTARATSKKRQVDERERVARSLSISASDTCLIPAPPTGSVRPVLEAALPQVDALSLSAPAAIQLDRIYHFRV
jgi:hypothetical protein